MKILFLGTGASDWPMEKPRIGDHRRYSSVLINGELLIDPGPCAPDALKEYKVDIRKIRYVIVTHRHSDHFSEETLRLLTASGAKFVEFAAGETKKIGRYTVRATEANHPTCNPTVHFLIDDGEKRIFYGLDGAWLLYSEVAAIKEKHVDLAVFDATIGNKKGDYRIFEHNNLKMIIEQKEALEKHIGRFVISHMAQSLHDSHDTLARQMKKEDIETAYDGLVINL